MKNFRDFLKEEVLPTVQVADGGLDISKPAVRAAMNAAIAGVVSQPAVTPYVVFNRLSKLLAQYHIVLPKRFLEGDKGVEVFELRQFGHKMGMTDSGEFVNEVPSTHYLFLQYGIITPFGITYAKPVVGGMFKVMARIVDKEELDKLIDMAEITMAEEAEVNQAIAKANAPREEMHDITSDEKKKGNKEAVGASEKKSLDELWEPITGSRRLAGSNRRKRKAVQMALGRKHKGEEGWNDRTNLQHSALKMGRKLQKQGVVKEELSHGARELTLHADNDSQLHRSSHQPIVKNLSRKHAKGAYDHDKATKLWGYHANRAAKSYEKQHGGKFSVADRKAAASHFADSARDEHGFGSVKEDKDPCWKGYEMIGMKKKGGKPVPNCVPVKEATDKDRDLSKLASAAISKGQAVKKLPAGRAQNAVLPKSMAKGPNIEKGRWSGHGSFSEEQIDEISKETKKSYVAKRGSQLSSLMYGSKNSTLTGRQQKNAVTGIKRAMKEEEQIDEVSKRLLGRYIKKAHVSGLGAAAEGEQAYSSKDKEALHRSNKTGEKREQGIERAINKMTGSARVPANEAYEKQEAGVKTKDGKTHTLHRRNPGHPTEYHTVTTKDAEGKTSVKVGKPKYIKKHWDKLEEKAPPGREKQVLALKKKFPKGSGSPFAIAWSSYNKSKGE